MTEFAKARSWRESRGLSVTDLARLSGYSRETIWAMERGEATASPRSGNKVHPIKEWVWQRYKTCCAGVDRQLRAGVPFDWEA